MGAVEVAQFQAGSGATQTMGTFALANLDSDPQLETIVAYQGGLLGGWVVDAFKINGAHVAGFPVPAPAAVNVSPTVVDLDADGKPEILLSAGNQVLALRRDGSTLWSHTVSSLNYVPDAGFEAVTNGFYWSLGGVFMPRLPLTASFSADVSSPFVTDVDGDGKPEVLTAWKIDPDTLTSAQDYNPFLNDIYGRYEEWGMTGETWSGGVRMLDTKTGDSKFTYHFHQLVEAGLAVGKPDEDLSLKVYVLNDADSVVAFDKTKSPGLFGSGMLYKQFGKNQRFLSGSYQTGVDLFTADLDGDGRAEVLVPSTQFEPNWQPSETLLDDDGAILWRKWKDPVGVPMALGWFNNACMIPVNPDHDNRIDVLSFTHSYEIAFRTWDGMNLVDRPGWPKNFAPLLPTPPVVGDVDGDGQEEIVIGLCDPSRTSAPGKLKVFDLQGNEKASLAFPAGVKQIPALADVDGDGKVDLVVRTLAGRVYVYNFGSKANAAVSWSTHRGSMLRDGNFARDLFPAGTPRVTTRTGNSLHASLGWTIPAGFAPTSIEVRRSVNANGPFTSVANLSGAARSYSDAAVQNGMMYFYLVVAKYGGQEVSSPPVPVLPQFSRNLVANGGFEENDNSHWDKWFTGDIDWNDMTSSSILPHSGKQSMEVRLKNQGSQSSITQYSHYGASDATIHVQPGHFYSFGGFLRSGGLSCDSEHWLEWDSSITSGNTNRRPNLPWPNYFTPSLKAAANASTDWKYVNRVFTMPNGFSNVELRHRFTTTQQANGSVFLDDLFLRELPTPSDPQWKTWLSWQSQWRYAVDAPAGNWSSAGFDDAAWPVGAAKFGAGSGPQNIKTAVPGRKPAYYFRKKFQRPAGTWDDILLGAQATDNYGGTVYPLQLWINGVEVPTAGIETVSGEGNDKLYYDLTPFAEFFHNGENVVAVKLNNVWQSDWDNVAFDMTLQAIPGASSSGPSARFQSLEYLPNNTVRIHIIGSGNWRFQSGSAAGGWIKVQDVTLESGVPQTIEVPCGQQNQLFRLVAI